MLIVVFEHKEQVSALEVRVEDKGPVIEGWFLGVCFGSYLGKTAFYFTFKVDACDVHKNTGEMLFFGG